MAKAIEVPCNIFEHMRTAVTASDLLCENVMPKVGFIRKSLIMKMERAKGFEPSTLTLAT